MRLEGKKALITGASRGLGRAIAVTFAGEGADLALHARTVEALKGTAEDVEATGRKAHCIAWDIADASQVDKRLAEARDALGGLDILVNNAGVLKLPPDDSGTTLESNYDYVMGINLKALYLLSEAAVKMMQEQRSGVIVNVASDAGMRGAPVPYGISKWGVIGYTRGLAQRVAKDGIRVNGIGPGPIATTMVGCEDGKPKDWPSGPLGRFAMLEEVADVALFLASDDSRAIFGHTIPINTANP